MLSQGRMLSVHIRHHTTFWLIYDGNDWTCVEASGFIFSLPISLFIKLISVFWADLPEALLCRKLNFYEKRVINAFRVQKKLLITSSEILVN